MGGLGLIAIIWHYYYSIRVTHDLAYPGDPKVLFLSVQQDVEIRRGAFKEVHFRGLGAGTYREVLRNEHGAFYLAPPMGYFVKASAGSGFGVGGIYVPAEETGEVYLWDYFLKNEDRSISNPSTSRAFSMEHDQPERANFLERDWYSGKGFQLTGRPMIDRDFVVEREAFTSASEAGF
ncbi:hypothetical protein V2O64_10650 [Verrucomicrobiaceae bacterium 227]